MYATKAALLAPLLIAISACHAQALAEESTKAGEVTTPYPTITNLAVEWQITGDENLNGVVTVRYRPTGEEAWHEAMPLRRVPAGQSKGTRPIFQWANKHSGSIFDLRPDTKYEIALKLTDPDGFNAEKTVFARTRPVPRPAADSTTRKVDPKTLAAALGEAGPGQVLLLAGGSYGQLTVGKDGAAGKPLVLRAEGKAVFDRVSLAGRKHVIVEGLTVNGSIDLFKAEECAVRYCTVKVEGKGFGIGAPRKPGATHCYIADNVVTGSSVWTNEAMGAGGRNEGEGIQITGPGNVICYNRVSSFRDCLSTMEDTSTGEQVCIDMYNNDVYVGADDGIEADFCMSNCRILRNRLTNCFTGLSSQPGLGGPTYFVRNVLYNTTYAAFKFHRYSQGDVVLHNTVLKPGDGLSCFASQPFDFAWFRNNVCIGGPSGGVRWGGYGGGTGQAARIAACGEHCSFDYDALGTHGLTFQGAIGRQRFASLADLRKGPHEKNAVQVDLGMFEGVAFPDKPLTHYAPVDLRPREGSAVVDKALRLPNVNDDFRGQGPDMGAHEASGQLPHYGPRPKGVDEETPSRK